MSQNQVPTRLGDVQEVAAFLAWKRLCQGGIPSLAQMNLYRREDGSYFCAVDGCEIFAPPQCKKDTMVTMGPIVLCHDHGCRVLTELKEALGQDLAIKWWYLSKTLYNAEVADNDQEDGRADRRSAKAAEGMKGRARHLAEALEWAPRHREYIARKRSEQSQQGQSDPAAQETVPQPPALESNPYIGKTMREIKRLETAVQKALAELDRYKAVLSPAEYSNRKGAYDKAAQQIALALSQAEQKKQNKIRSEQSAAAAEKLAKLDELLGIGTITTSSGIRVEVCARGQVTTVSKPKNPAVGRKRDPAQFSCNCNLEIKGDPKDGLSDIKPFQLSDFQTSADCDKALDATGESWRRILMAHAPENAERDDVLKSGTDMNKGVKKKAKSCLLHGPLARLLSNFRFEVIQLYMERWPAEWKKRMARVKDGNGQGGHATGKEQCSDCKRLVNKLFPSPDSASIGEDGRIRVKDDGLPTLCGVCRKRQGNKVTRDAREAKATQKSIKDQQNGRDHKGPTGQQGGGKRGKGGKDGGKKGRKKGK